MTRFGYCCISLGVNEGLGKAERVSVNRGMIKRTFDQRGLGYVSELAVQNLRDTIRVLEWNLSRGTMVYRLSSDSLPWMTHYRIEDLPGQSDISALLAEIGKIVLGAGMRVSYHPGPFCVLASENPDVVSRTVDELDKHSLLMDMMGLPATHDFPINIHVGTTRPSLEDAAARFCHGTRLIGQSCRSRLTVENDDSPTQFSVASLHRLVHSRAGVPIVADTLHHACHPDEMDWEQALRLAASTWTTRPMCHHSSSRKAHEDPSAKREAHADFIYSRFQDHGLDLDVELECKQKDLAAARYLAEFHGARTPAGLRV